MKQVVFAAAMLLLIAVSATGQEAENVFSSSSLLIALDISGGIDVAMKGPQYNVEFVEANLTLHPAESPAQHITAASIVPTPMQKGNALIFRWEDAQPSTLGFSAITEVLVDRSMPAVRKKVPFPAAFPDDVQEYTRATTSVDADTPEIIALATALASGKDDQYAVVHDFAAWVQGNVQYNLSTLNSEASLPASFVLESRQGVCDELSVLFIALNRAVGIPARFVAGMAYTDSELFEENWGLHGWAEVYFPGTGWVPFDVTYGEFGYLDASHIALLYSADPTQATTSYRWQSRDASIVPRDLKINAKIKETGAQLPSELKLVATPVEKRAGFGSFNLVELELENSHNYYVSADIVPSRTKNLRLVDEKRRIVLVPPKSVRKEYFTYQVADALDSAFIYTFPVSFSINRVGTAETSFSASAQDSLFSEERMRSLIPSEEAKAYDAGIDLSCSTAAEYYSYETADASCTIRNIGNVALETLQVCHASDCQKITLGISKGAALSFRLILGEPGTQRERISVSGDAAAAELVSFRVLDVPAISIVSVSAPDTVKFDEAFSLSFTLERKSLSIPQDIVVDAEVNGVSSKWVLDSLETTQEYVLHMEGSLLKEGSNEVRINAAYHDKNKRAYAAQAQAEVSLVDVTFLQRMKIGVYKLDNWLRNLG